MTLNDPFPIGVRADGSPILLGGRADDPGLTFGGKSDLTASLLAAATPPPPGPPVTDPEQLGGFDDIDGLRLSFIGEDGDHVVIIGHHDDDAVAAALAAFLRQFGYDDIDEIVRTGCRSKVYGLFTLDPDSPSENWWCDWTGTEPHPDRIAMTLIDIE